ncbi:MAG TPA: hypothetical protein DDX14_04120, partial [Cyanobacteria bacterium UBA9579]|nr:hypothetical protein [Cyanobacteria bacterium UBA9579]
YQPMPYQIPSMYPPQPAPYQIPNVFQNPFNNPSSNVFNQSDGVMGQVDQFITDVNTGTFQNMVNIDPNAGKNPQNLKDPAAAKYYNNQPISPEANIFNQADKLDDTVLEFVKQHGGTPLI